MSRMAGRTIITISHNLSETFFDQCDSVLRMQLGAVVDDGQRTTTIEQQL